MTEVKIFESPLLQEETVSGIVIAPGEDQKDMGAMDSFYKSRAVTPQQTHSVNVGIVESQTDIFPDTDALITFSPHLPIGIRTADCVPILIYSP
ncbi:MAG: laccase domain-containing protein [Muribaculaceae bacterium]|nr:laccase domain-containing protein [Muribaculaceae bacterium]